MRTVGTSAGKRAEAGQTADGRTFRVGAPGPWRRMAAHGGDNNFGSNEKTLAKSACML